MKQIFAYRMDN